jgi:hypothetical protein
MIFVGNDVKGIEQLKHFLSSKFHIQDLSKLRSFWK